MFLIVLNADISGRDSSVKTWGVDNAIKKTGIAYDLSMTDDTKAWLGLGLLVLAIIVIPNPYGTWLVALIFVVIAVAGAMSMVDTENWIVGLIAVIIIGGGLLLLLFLGSAGGGGGDEIPRIP
jgi:hypothetical protein